MSLLQCAPKPCLTSQRRQAKSHESNEMRVARKKIGSSFSIILKVGEFEKLALKVAIRQLVAGSLIGGERASIGSMTGR